jgi:hypothetical protein
MGPLAATEPVLTALLRLETQRLDTGAPVRTVTEGLLRRATTGTPPILSSSHQFDSDRLLGCHHRFFHRIFLK